MPVQQRSIQWPFAVPSLGGLVWCFAIVGSSWLMANPLGGHNIGLGLLPLAMILGVLSAALLKDLLSRSDSGLQWSKTIALRTGLALFGFQISLAQVAELGILAVLAAPVILGSTLALANFAGGLLGISPRQRMLVGMGSAVCGAAAIVATESSWKGANAETAAALATALVFGGLSMFSLPLFAHWMGMPAQQLGVWIGLATHEMGHVAAAAELSGNELTMSVAVIEKMIRVTMLAPAVFLVVRFFASGNDGNSAPARPPFYLWAFAMAVAINSLFEIPEPVTTALNHAAQLFMAMGLAALGLTTRLHDLKAAGLRVWILGAILCAQLWVFGLVLVQWVQLGAATR